jgi:hypothetical protein
MAGRRDDPRMRRGVRGKGTGSVRGIGRGQGVRTFYPFIPIRMPITPFHTNIHPTHMDSIPLRILTHISIPPTSIHTLTTTMCMCTITTTRVQARVQVPALHRHRLDHPPGGHPTSHSLQTCIQMPASHLRSRCSPTCLMKR